MTYILCRAQDVEVRHILCARSCAHRIWYVPYPVPGTGYDSYASLLGVQ